MTGVVIGAAIVAFTALKAGPALLAVIGRQRNLVVDLAWPLGLWILALILVYALIPQTPLLEESQVEQALTLAAVAVSLVCGIPLARLGWSLWRADNSTSG